jgi:hypothetical protein
MEKNKRMGRDSLKAQLDWLKDAAEEKKDKGKQKERPAVERTQRKIARRSTQEGLRSGWTRATFVLREKWLELLKVYAKNEGRSLKKVVDEALKEYLEGKEIKPTGDIPDLRYKDEDDEEWEE